jgi:hypothetical protein
MRNVFWTGGWDSTFRVLDLIINQQEIVRPFYLIDSDRPSTRFELQTMQTIREQLATQFPEALDRLKPLETYQADQIKKDREITKANKAIRADRLFGSQYHWIARYVKQQGMGRFEMSLDRDDKPRKLLLDCVEREGDTAHVAGEFEGTPEHTLFQWFDFPLPVWGRNKSEMGDVARDSGFLDLLEQSWFCHFPVNNEACGGCGPCRHAIKDGMGYRLPWRARYVRRPKRFAISWLKRKLPPVTVARMQRLKQKLSA